MARKRSKENQGVVGSNPAGRASLCSKIKGLGLTTQAFFLCPVLLARGCTIESTPMTAPDGPEALRIARQGHRYTYHQKNVLALATGPVVRVLEFSPTDPWLSNIFTVSADKLIPQPMKYHGNQIP